MKTSLLHKEGIELLVEEVMANDDVEKNFLNTKEVALEKLKNENPEKADIIELRNDSTIHFLEDENNALERIMNTLSRYAFSKKVYFKDAITEIFKINLILNTKYSLKDIFTNAKIEKCKDCDRIDVTFDIMNFDIIKKYRETVAKYISYCHDCLFSDLYDRDTLTKYLPVVYFLLSVDLC